MRDWIIDRQNSDEDLSALTFLDAYHRGDLDGDLDNDVDDFALFKIAFNGANGAGAFEEMVASVPEPPTIRLLMLASLVLVVRLDIAERSIQRLRGSPTLPNRSSSFVKAGPVSDRNRCRGLAMKRLVVG